MVIKHSKGGSHARWWPRCLHTHISDQAREGVVCLRGRSRSHWTLSGPQTLDPSLHYSRKQKSLFGKHTRELSRKKVLEVSRSTVPGRLLSQGRSSLQLDLTTPKPQFCPRVTPTSGAFG